VAGVGEAILEFKPIIQSPSGNDFPVQSGFQSRNEGFSSHAARAQSHRFAAGPGLAGIKEIKSLRTAWWSLHEQTGKWTPRLAKKTVSRWDLF